MPDRPGLPSNAHAAAVALGSNEGDRAAFIERAIALIGEIPETRVVRRSSLREYAAEDVPGPQGPFLNAALLLETELPPTDLLEKLEIIERKLGRTAKGKRGARPIDLDILFYGESVVLRGKRLTLPHPRLHERRFVLEPLVEIRPDWVHPKLGKTARELLDGLNPAGG